MYYNEKKIIEHQIIKLHFCMISEGSWDIKH